jgi:hypothetical protein
LRRRSPTNEGNARTAAYEALSDLALFSAADTIELVSRLGEEMLSRMEKLLSMQVSCRSLISLTKNTDFVVFL